jgi:hypothetical protein
LRNRNWDKLTSHLAESAKKHIKESGSNSYGEYIQFDDGTQICTRVISSGTSISSALNASNFNFAKNFISAPYVHFAARGNILNPETYDLYDNVYISAAEHEWKFRARTTMTLAQDITLMAIGRWK